MMQLIETIYDESKAPVASDVITFNATVLPRLIRESTIAKTYEKMMAFMGTSQPGRTCASQEENGVPRSRDCMVVSRNIFELAGDRTNAHSWRDDVAKLVTQPKRSIMIKMAVITEAPACDCVAL